MLYKKVARKYQKKSQKYVPRSKAAISKLIRKEIHKEAEPMYKVWTDQGTGISSIVANNPYTLNVLGNIPIGTGNGTRLDDTIFVRRLDAKLQFTLNSATIPNATYRVLLIWNAFKSLQTDSFQSSLVSGIPLATYSYGGTGLNNPAGATVDTTETTVLYDRTITMNAASTSSANLVHTLSINKVLNCKQQFVTNTGAGKTRNLMLVVVANSPQATGFITSMGPVYFNGRLTYESSK